MLSHIKVIIFGVFVVTLLGIMGCGGPDGSVIPQERYFTPQELANLNFKYRISQAQPIDTAMLEFNLSFNMPRDRTWLAMKLPKNFLRKNNLHERIIDLQVLSSGSFQSVNNRPDYKILNHDANKEVRIRYFYLRHSPRKPKDAKDSFSAPIIRDNYAQFVGSMAFVTPLALTGGQNFNFLLEYDFPTEFKIFTSIGAEENRQSKQVDYRTMADLLFIMGTNLRTYVKKIREKDLYVVLDGHWDQISDEEFVDIFEKIKTYQAKTWNLPPKYMLASGIALPGTCANLRFAGTAHYDSLRFYYPKPCEMQVELKVLLSHEAEHDKWGKIVKVGKERGHVDGKWFTEGFTDWSGRITAKEAGLISQEEYFMSLDRQLQNYFLSSARLATLKDVTDRMYKRGLTSRAIETVPYQRGEILAWRLNAAIINKYNFQKSLRDPLKKLVQMGLQNGGSKNFSVEELTQVFDQYVPGVFRQEYDKIVRGDVFIPPELNTCTNPSYGYYAKFGDTQKRTSVPVYSYSTQAKNHDRCDAWLRGHP